MSVVIHNLCIFSPFSFARKTIFYKCFNDVRLIFWADSNDG